MIVFPLDCLPCFEWWLFPLWPVLAQPWVAGSASFSAYSLFDGSLFNLGLLAVFHMVLVPSVTSPFLALGYWQCFMWCLYPLWPVPFQPWVTGSASCGACSLFDEALFNLGLLAMFHMVLIPSLMSRCSALGYWPCFMWCLYPLWPLTFQPLVTDSASYSACSLFYQSFSTLGWYPCSIWFGEVWSQQKIEQKHCFRAYFKTVYLQGCK